MNLEVVLIIIIILIILYILIGNILYFFIFSSSKDGLFKIIDRQIEKMLKPYKKIYDVGLKFYNKIEKTNLHIVSDDGIDLYGTYIENNKTNYVIILCHGYRSTKERDVLASIKNYYDWGYSLLTIDERGCGLSKSKHITFGYKECQDINKWVDFINKKYNKEVILGGVSLGASSVLMVNNEHVKLIIEDSGYDDAYKEIKYAINHYSKLPLSIFMPIIKLYAKIFIKIDITKINVYNNLKKLNVPILFIHGSNDEFVPTKNVERMYKKYKGPKELLIIDEAEHGMGYLVDKNKYIRKVKNFINKYINK